MGTSSPSWARPVSVLCADVSVLRADGLAPGVLEAGAGERLGRTEGDTDADGRVVEEAKGCRPAEVTVPAGRPFSPGSVPRPCRWTVIAVDTATTTAVLATMRGHRLRAVRMSVGVRRAGAAVSGD